MDFYSELQKICESVKKDEPMSDHTTFKIGGAADYMVMPKNTDEIIKTIEICKKENIPYTVLGNGSNVLVSDRGIEGVVIKTAENMTEIRVTDCEIYAEAGAMLSAVSRAAQHAGLAGLEFAAGIPGTLGGAVVMNAGAYGGEMKDVITEVGYMDNLGNICKADCGQCGFGYRKSIFSDGEKIVLWCRMRLKEGKKGEIAECMAELNKRRRDKQPLNMPSAGSTFKRPEGYFAGKLIEDCGLKGLRVGGAEVSEKHSGFVVNAQSATAEDVKKLIAEVQKRVYERFGVMLEPEVKMLGR